jgi:hypothetical protein
MPARRLVCHKDHRTPKRLDDSGSQLHSGNKISGEFVVACGDSSKVLEFIEEALDEVAFAVEREIANPVGFAVRFWRDDRSDFALGQGGDKRIGVEGLVGDQGVGIGGFNQIRGARQIMGLTWGEDQVDRIAKSIDKSVDFGCQSAARPADRLRAVFFRAPALCW